MTASRKARIVAQAQKAGIGNGTTNLGALHAATSPQARSKMTGNKLRTANAIANSLSGSSA